VTLDEKVLSKVLAIHAPLSTFRRIIVTKVCAKIAQSTLTSLLKASIIRLGEGSGEPSCEQVYVFLASYYEFALAAKGPMVHPTRLHSIPKSRLRIALHPLVNKKSQRLDLGKHYDMRGGRRALVDQPTPEKIVSLNAALLGIRALLEAGEKRAIMQLPTAKKALPKIGAP